MARINLLDKKTAELIAAGEVIERPSSVVKELVENSIDAGATSITVEIKNGGVRLIRITDNGCGIQPEDIPKAFLRHATSKVTGVEDLSQIGTLGFRGEALASICAVSRVELVTRTNDSAIGYSYHIEGGEGDAQPQEAGCPVGSSIYVRDIFYNIPARMKFLKKDVTEGNAIAALLDRLALSHPEVSICFIRDGQQKLKTPGDGKLLSAINSVYGREFGSGLIAVSGGVGSARVTGYITRPEKSKASRSMEHFFINQRYVRSVTMMAALEEAYRNSLMTGKFPGCVLNLELPLGSVDVNVHPAKLEVKLSDEKLVFDAVYDACKGALAAMSQAVAAADTASRGVKNKLTLFDITNKHPVGEQQRITASQYRNAVSVGLADNSADKLYKEQLKKNTDRQDEPIVSRPPVAAAFCGRTQQPVRQNDISAVFAPPTKAERVPEYRQQVTKVDSPAIQPTPSAAVQQPVPQETEAAAQPMLLVGEAFSTYIIAQQGEQLLLIDKHAAHERILFNKLKTEYGNGVVGRQILLASVRLSFSKEIYDTLVSNLPAIARLGFLAEDFGGGSIIIRELPSTLELGQLEDVMLELGEKLQKGQSRPEMDIIDEMLHTIACKAAVKGGYFTGELEQKNLLETLEKDSTLRSCPHGRPIMIELTRREIEKMFGRIV